MIAKGSSIAHGAEALQYGQDKANSVFVYGHRIAGNNTEDWLMQMQLVQHSHDRIKNKFLRFEISPSIGEGKELRSVEDWRKLAQDFVGGMGLDDHQCVAILHQDRKHRHLHIIANRISVNGIVKRDHQIGRKAGEIAKQIATTRKWKNVDDISKVNKYQCWLAIKDCMRNLNAYTWDRFKSEMNNRGYTITENRRKDGSINGYYILMPGHTLTPKYKGVKASSINRNCTINKLPQLWQQQHPESLDLDALAATIVGWLRSSHKGTRVSDGVIIRRGNGGWAIRCKIDGVQQMGIDIPRRYCNVISSLNDSQREELFGEIANKLINSQYRPTGIDYDNTPHTEDLDDVMNVMCGGVGAYGAADSYKNKKKKR